MRRFVSVVAVLLAIVAAHAADGGTTIEKSDRSAARTAEAAPLPTALPGISRPVVIDDGRTPITEPTTITTSGSYVVVRDIVAPDGPALRIQGNVDVVIDFLEHKLATTSSLPTVRIDATRGTSPCASVVLRNGSIVGNPNGIVSNYSRNCPIEVRLESMQLTDADVWLEDASLTALGSSFLRSDLVTDSNFTGALAEIRGNRFLRSELGLHGVVGAQVRDNELVSGSISAWETDGWVPTEFLVASNTITAGKILIFGRTSFGSNINVTGNVVDGPIELRRLLNFRVEDNIVSKCVAGGGAIDITESRYGLIEGNQTIGCAEGLRLDSLSAQNTYRRNVFRAFTVAPVLDEGADNTNAGGNVP